MKRFCIVAILAAIAFSVGAAHAATTMKATGELAFAYQWSDNTNFLDMDGDNTSEDDFRAAQRTRLTFEWIANEALRAVIGFEVGGSDWGVSGGGADLDADDSVVEVRWAYLDFAWPDTALKFRMGVQKVELPFAVTGSPVFGAEVPGILSSYKFNDTVAASFGWFRVQNAYAASDGANAADGIDDEMDMLALLVPIKGEGFTFTPWAAFAMVGQNASLNANTNVTRVYSGLTSNSSGRQDDSLNAFWLGGAFTLNKFDPLVIKADFVYGFTDGVNASDEGGVGERAGWLFDLGVDYKMDLVTPGLFFMYSTGEDDDRAKSERLPVMYCAQGYRPTSFGFGGGSGMLTEWDGILGNTATGRIMIGGQLDKFSFMDKLTHTFRVLYGQGTNDPDYVKKGYASMDYNANHGLPLTSKDSFVEVNFDSTYSIYENLSAVIEMGWINLDLDEDTWKGHTDAALGRFDPANIQDAWRLAISLIYRF